MKDKATHRIPFTQKVKFQKKIDSAKIKSMKEAIACAAEIPKVKPTTLQEQLKDLTNKDQPSPIKTINIKAQKRKII